MHANISHSNICLRKGLADALNFLQLLLLSTIYRNTLKEMSALLTSECIPQIRRYKIKIMHSLHFFKMILLLYLLNNSFCLQFTGLPGRKPAPMKMEKYNEQFKLSSLYLMVDSTILTNMFIFYNAASTDFYMESLLHQIYNKEGGKNTRILCSKDNDQLCKIQTFVHIFIPKTEQKRTTKPSGSLLQFCSNALCCHGRK